MAAQKYQRILSLGEERVAVINNQLAGGASAQTVARLIQQDWKEFQDVAEKTLMQQLLRYRADNIDSAAVVKEMALPAEHPKVRQLESRMNVLGEMIDLARLHKKRVEGFVEREKDLKMPIKGTSDDIALLSTLLKDVQKLQFDLGIDDFQGPVVQGGKVTQTRITQPDGTVIDSQTTEAVQGALELLQNHKKVIEGESVVVPSKPD